MAPFHVPAQCVSVHACSVIFDPTRFHNKETCSRARAGGAAIGTIECLSTEVIQLVTGQVLFPLVPAAASGKTADKTGDALIRGHCCFR